MNITRALGQNRSMWMLMAPALWTLMVAPVLHAADEVPAPAAVSAKASPKLRSAEDGWVDMGEFIDQAYGFVPLVIPITEPAVGYGGAGGLAFIDKPQGEAQAGFGRPNITAVGGLGTENGTWGVMAADVRHWLDDRLQTTVGMLYASVNLDYFGIGENSLLKDHPLTYNLEPLGGMVQAKYRLGNSRFWGGLGYTLASTDVSFDAPATTPGVPDFQRESRAGGLIPSLTYDSRDTMFTPSRGTYAELTAGLFSEALGGNDKFQRVNLTAMHFLPLHPKLTLGIRGDANLSFGDEPFYLRPAIALRGTPGMRYTPPRAVRHAACQKQFPVSCQFSQLSVSVQFVFSPRAAPAIV